jgi:hypothetical protein
MAAPDPIPPISTPPAGSETAFPGVVSGGTPILPSTPTSNGPVPVSTKPLPGSRKANRHVRNATWTAIMGHANVVGSVAALFLFLMAVGAIGGYYWSKSSPTVVPKTTISTLSPSDLAKLNEIGSNLGSSGQTLNIGADALFRGKANIGGDLTVGGRFNANGPVTLSQLNISGTTAVSGLNVGSNMQVTGTTTLQQGLTVNGLGTFNNGINVSGSSSMNTLNANTLAVRTISISGPLMIGHLTTQGPVPTFVTGTAVGAGGTASISGNDTAGTLNFNTGNTPPAGVLGTITFRAGFTSTVHVLLSPLTSAAASTQTYVTRTSGGFQVHTANTPPAGSVLSFDYFVTQ